MTTELDVPIIEAVTYRRSSDISELFAAKAKAQLSIENATKDANNPHFSSKYATLASVSDACLQALAEQGISPWQFPTSAPDSVSVTTLFGHSSGQWIESTLSVKLTKFDAQAIVAATTYLRRCALAAFAMVAPEDDDGNTAAAAAPPPPLPRSDPAILEAAKTAAHRGTNALREHLTKIDGSARAQLRGRIGSKEEPGEILRIAMDADALLPEPTPSMIFAMTDVEGKIMQFSDPVEASEFLRGEFERGRKLFGTAGVKAALENSKHLVDALAEGGFDDLVDACSRTYEIEMAKAEKPPEKPAEKSSENPPEPNIVEQAEAAMDDMPEPEQTPAEEAEYKVLIPVGGMTAKSWYKVANDTLRRMLEEKRPAQDFHRFEIENAKGLALLYKELLSWRRNYIDPKLKDGKDGKYAKETKQ